MYGSLLDVAREKGVYVFLSMGCCIHANQSDDFRILLCFHISLIIYCLCIVGFGDEGLAAVT